MYDEPTEPADSSTTGDILDAVRLYGFRRDNGEPDTRPYPDDARLDGAVAELFDALIAGFADSPLETDLAEALSSLVHLFQRQLGRIDRLLDRNEAAQRDAQRTQDGSEVRSVALEALIDEGRALCERRACHERLRDTAMRLYGEEVGESWRPRSGSRVSRQALTSAILDSRDFIAAKRQAALAPLLPTGVKIAVAGGVDYQDVARIWSVLDNVRAKHAEMALLHGGATRGAELIASKWAEARKVPQIVFRPDWTRDGKAAPFRRNDLLLAQVPIGLVVFPGAGVTDNLADKAKRMGIPVLDQRG